MLNTDSVSGRVCNERQQMANTLLMSIVDTPPHADPSANAEQKPVPSKRRRLNFLPSISRATGMKKMKQLEGKRGILRLGNPTKKDWNTIVSRRGKGLKVKKEDREKIVKWVKEHPNVVNSPIARDTILCPAPTVADLSLIHI